MFTLVAMFVFSALGGAWFPLAIAGKGFGTVGHAMPTAWALDGFQNIIVRGQGLAGVLLPAAVVLAYAAGFFVLALWRFKFEQSAHFMDPGCAHGMSDSIIRRLEESNA